MPRFVWFYIAAVVILCQFISARGFTLYDYPLYPALCLLVALSAAAFATAYITTNNSYALFAAWLSCIIWPVAWVASSLWAMPYIHVYQAIAAAIFLTVLVVGSLITACAHFSHVNDIHWLLPFIIVTPLNVILVTTAWDIWGPELNILDAFRSVVAALFPHVAESFNNVITRASKLLEWSIQLRLQLLALYAIGVIGTLGVMEAIKAPATGSPLEYGATKAWLVVTQSLRAIRPVISIWWFVTAAMVLTLSQPILFLLILYVSFMLVGIGYQPFSWDVTGGIIVLIAALFALVPLFFHLAHRYPLVQLGEVSYVDWTKAGQNVLLWILFLLVTCSLLLRGKQWDYSKAVALIIGSGWLIAFAVFKAAQSLSSHYHSFRCRR